MELTDDRRIAAGVLYSTIFHMMKRSPTKYVADGDINKLKKLAEQNALKYEQELTQGEREYILRLATKMGETMAEKARLSGHLQDHSGHGSGIPGGQAKSDSRPDGRRGAGNTGPERKRDEVVLGREVVPEEEDPGGVRSSDDAPRHGDEVRSGDPGQAGPQERGAKPGDARPERHEDYSPDRALYECLAELRRLSEVQITFVTEVIDRINSFNS